LVWVTLLVGVLGWVLGWVWVFGLQLGYVHVGCVALGSIMHPRNLLLLLRSHHTTVACNHLTAGEHCNTMS
jgi:hypothetical protein